MSALQHIFEDLFRKCSADEKLMPEYWNEIEKRYSEKGRYYHTLAHLEDLHQKLRSCENELKEQESVLFALFYHDVIYNPLRQDNEEKSAEFAAGRLEKAGVKQEVADKCALLILATKKHSRNPDHDVNLFTDADLSVLGASAEVYRDYAAN